MFDLDSPAGRHFKFRDFIECGETWESVSKEDPRFDNRPAEEHSWVAIGQLATMVLDPIWDRFGPLVLTYGFSSRSLAKLISRKPNAGISPSNDQHASCELNVKGRPVCVHLGASCDFGVSGCAEGMRAIAQWIAEELQFDSLYYYGDARPVHVSWGPEHRRNVVLMRTHETTGRRSPGSHGRNEKGVALLVRASY